MRSDGGGRWPVAIVGGGFSGTTTALQLARRGIGSVLIDGSGRIGRGVAYSTDRPEHVLNIPSGRMSAWPDHPMSFADWNGDDGDVFAQRSAFGRYLAEQFDAAPEVGRIVKQAIGAEPMQGGWVVMLEEGSAVHAAALVLALGNQPPAPMGVAAGLPADRFINDPWSLEAEAAIGRAATAQADVLLLGTGLTMVDMALALTATGHSGRVTALSRRGLLPHGHLQPPTVPAPVTLGEVPLGRLLPLWRWLRRRSAEVGFRSAVDALRPHSHAVWQSLPAQERARFLRHARPWWDIHRHRLAPQVADQVQRLKASGRLELMAGRLRSLRLDSGGGLHALIDRRGGGEAEREVALVINCTGPLGDLRCSDDPLVRRLLGGGVVSADPLGLGLAVDEHDRAGRRLWAVGPLTKGRYWEITAVPDIREQVATVAAEIAAELVAA